MAAGLSRQKAFTVAHDGVVLVAAAAVDPHFIRQAAADEAVREDSVVIGTQTHALHVVAVRRRVDRQVARPATAAGPT